mmetsp:Transcript_983/g.3108  ORF Transcript_983/g.3108 Transcript_983/m.3108 type:complete len:300 (-) Transcript_983:520-1419(-)
MDNQLTKFGVCLNHFSHEQNHIRRRSSIRVVQEIDKDMNNISSDFWELDHAVVDCLNQHLTVFRCFLRVCVLSFGNLLLENSNNFVDAARAHELHHQIQDLLADVDVGRSKSTNNIHDERLQYFGMLLLKIFQLIENNELDVVVAVSAEQVTVCLHGGSHGGLGTRERNESGSTFKGHRIRSRALEVEDCTDILALLEGILTANFANKFQHHELHNIAHGVNGVDDAQLILYRPFLVAVAKHNKSIPFRRHIVLPVNKFTDEFWCVRHQIFKALVGVVDGKNSIPSNIAMAMLEIRSQR